MHLNITAGRATLLLLLHLSAVFDTIDHNLLLAQLFKWFGVEDLALNWFHSYLSDWTQVWKLTKFILWSICWLFCALGSALSLPLNSIASYSCNISIVSMLMILAGLCKYHSLYCWPWHAICKLQHCLTVISDWVTSNKLQLNPSQTEFLLFDTN